MAENNNSHGTGFSEDYVKELRQENASWRTKVRDLEQRVQLGEVKTELLKRGVDVNPKWVELSEGMEVGQAVDKFLTDYPQFNTKQTDTQSTTKHTNTQQRAPKPMNSNTDNSVDKPKFGSYGGRSLDEVKKDPKARADLRSTYRQLLSQNSNQRGE